MPTDMPRCETCRHWENVESDDSYRSFRDGFGLCKGIPFTENLTAADRIAEMRRQLAADPEGRNASYLRTRLETLKPVEEQIAYTADASGYMADLRTRGSFGCIAHEPKEG